MKVSLLGTGSADGWPNPWCGCASCVWARGREVRGHTAALLDGVLMLDCGPDVPRAAARLGVSLDGVRHLLLGHAHPDHTGPHALMWRSWSTAARVPLDLLAPPAAVAACRPWLGEADPVRVTEAAAGDRVALGGYDVRVLAANHGDASIGPAVLYDVTGPDGSRLLYVVDSAYPLPPATLAAAEGAAYDVVLLEETNGDGPAAGDHHDLADFAATCAELRRRGAVTAGTRVVAVHLGHRNPPGAELGRRLALLGAEALPDGATLSVREPRAERAAGAGRDGPPPRPRARRVLITGGARSGKSAEAERRLAGEPDVLYAATAGPVPPGDPEWAARVAAHRQRRPAGWTTLETTDLEQLLRTPGPPLLVDCLTLWLAAQLEQGDDQVAAATAGLVSAWRDTAREVVAVTNEVGSGVVPATASGRRFRDALGRLNAAVATDSDEVWHVVAGVGVRLR